MYMSGDPDTYFRCKRNHIPGSGLHYTKTVDMSIRDHTNKTRFVLADMIPGYLDGYLPMAWLKDPNLDNN